jgi:hypothetical protein
VFIGVLSIKKYLCLVKKGLIFLLAILYVTLTSGIVVNIHYCMGRVAGVTYGAEGEHHCDKCGMEQKKGCCDTEHKLVKADSDHIYAKTIAAPSTFAAITPTVFSEFNFSLIPSPEYYTRQYHSPPDFRSNNLSVYNSVFRI